MAFVLPSLLSLCPSRGEAQERPFPYELTNQDGIVAPITTVSGVLGLILASKTDPVTLDEIYSLDRDNVNNFDRGATYNWSTMWQDKSDHPRNLLLATSVLLSGVPLALHGERSDAVTMGVIFLEAASLTTAATYILKGVGKRLRPYTYNTSFTPEERLAVSGPDDPSVRQSFISGHASSAFAVATLLSTVFEDVHGSSTTSKIVWASSLSLASLTAYGRVKGGVHFPSDVLTGAALGAAIGYLVPALHRVDADEGVSLSVGPGSVQLRLAVGGR